MGQNIKHGDVFIFIFIFIGICNKLMKLLHADDGGLVMYVKRLEAMANVKTTMIDIRVIIHELISGTPLCEMEMECVSFITKLLFLKLIIFIFAVNIVCNLH